MNRVRPDCACPACRPGALRYTSRPLPECSECGQPMNRDRYERNGGVCTRCIPAVPSAFRSARDRALAEQKADQRVARLAAARARRGASRGR